MLSLFRFIFITLLTLNSSSIFSINLEKCRRPVTIAESSLDELVLNGVRHIKDCGEEFNARAGSGRQAYDVSYTLLDPKNRLHSIRKPRSTRYFCRESLAYFKGSLDVDEGLAQASTVWKKLADKNNMIASNYGYYVFHQNSHKFMTKQGQQLWH